MSTRECHDEVSSTGRLSAAHTAEFRTAANTSISVVYSRLNAKRMLCGALLILLGVARCAGPVSLTDAIDHDDETAYVKRLNARNFDARAAFFAWKSEQTGRSAETIADEDAALSTTRNPFDAYQDTDAVRRGAVLFRYHCARCHGEDASGHGPAILPDHPANDFHAFGQRFAATLHRGAPRRWFKSITQGFGGVVQYPDEPPGPAMPAFGTRLAKEQVWLLITYLQSLDVHFPTNPDAATTE